MKQLFNNIASMPGVTAEMAMELFTILLRDWAVRVLDAADPHWGHGRVSGWPAVVISTDREAPAKTRWFRQKSGPLSYDAARLAAAQAVWPTLSAEVRAEIGECP